MRPCYSLYYVLETMISPPTDCSRVQPSTSPSQVCRAMKRLVRILYFKIRLTHDIVLDCIVYHTKSSNLSPPKERFLYKL